jgi:hypothetical protein
MSAARHIPDEMILAALDRAVRHRDGDGPVTIWSIRDHLALSSRSRAARHVRTRLPALAESGAVERSRTRGFVLWSLTSAGRGLLAQARRAGSIELPESPQHRAWREARALAEHEIERFHASTSDAITDAMEAVESESSSDALFAVAERLSIECWRLASATYCLREWPEPNDATADVDDRLNADERQLPRAERNALLTMRAGRRTIINWGRRGA